MFLPSCFLAAPFLIFSLSVLLLLCWLGLFLLFRWLSLCFFLLLRWLGLGFFLLLCWLSLGFLFLCWIGLLHWLFALSLFLFCRLGFFLLGRLSFFLFCRLSLFLLRRLGLLLLSWLGGFLVCRRLGRFFVVLFLRESRNRVSEKQEHGCSADNSEYFHECCLHYREIHSLGVLRRAWFVICVRRRTPYLHLRVVY